VTQAEDDRDLYIRLLDEQRLRSQAAQWLIESGLTYPNLESAALQMRFMLELVPLGALVANREWIEPVATAFARKDPGEAKKLVKRVNPDYWPFAGDVEAGKRLAGKARHTFTGIREGVLREQDWAPEWGYLSGLLHAGNPYRDRPDLETTRDRLIGLLERIRRLLKCHVLLLPGHDLALVGFLETESGGAGVMTLERKNARDLRAPDEN
jgi:hypothetical protein